MIKSQNRKLFHSFPRLKGGETEDAALERGLKIFEVMKNVGLVLAPELVFWDISDISAGAEKFDVLQRRACFTELSLEELAAHGAVFGPIALAFDINKLRGAGATPVIYVPQGIETSHLSQIGTFCVHGIWHTQHVLRQLLELKIMSDPELTAKRFGRPVDPKYGIKLQNTDPAGKVVANYDVPAANVQQVLQHVGFNNIPFDQSIGILNVFSNMFYPTDNTHSGEQLGYYRQREWRLIAGDINFNGRPMGRSLSKSEASLLKEIDPHFWTGELTVDGVSQQRTSLALIYDPLPGWNFFEIVEAVFVPERAVSRIRNLIGDMIAVHSHP